MYTNFALNNLAKAINDIIIPKFHIYVTDRCNDLTVKELVEKEISHIEDLEDIVIEMTDNYDFSEETSYNSIVLDGYHFSYNKDHETFYFEGDKEEAARSRILFNNGLSYTYSAENEIKTRILAILITLPEVSFPETVKSVEKQIDFNEFIKPIN